MKWNKCFTFHSVNCSSFNLYPGLIWSFVVDWAQNNQLSFYLFFLPSFTVSAAPAALLLCFVLSFGLVMSAILSVSTSHFHFVPAWEFALPVHLSAKFLFHPSPKFSWSRHHQTMKIVQRCKCLVFETPTSKCYLLAISVKKRKLKKQ